MKMVVLVECSMIPIWNGNKNIANCKHKYHVYNSIWCLLSWRLGMYVLRMDGVSKLELLLFFQKFTLTCGKSVFYVGILGYLCCVGAPIDTSTQKNYSKWKHQTWHLSVEHTRNRLDKHDIGSYVLKKLKSKNQIKKHLKKQSAIGSNTSPSITQFLYIAEYLNTCCCVLKRRLNCSHQSEAYEKKFVSANSIIIIIRHSTIF